MPATPQVDELPPAADAPTESAFLAEVLGSQTEPTSPAPEPYDPSPRPQNAAAPGEFDRPNDIYDPTPRRPLQAPPPAAKDEPPKPRGFFKRRK